MPSNIRGGDNFDSGEVIGQNQTWQDLTVSRALGITYTNDTGRPIVILVDITATAASASCGIEVLINGVGDSNYVLTGSTASLFGQHVSLIIPNGDTYRVNNLSGASLGRWRELR